MIRKTLAIFFALIILLLNVSCSSDKKEDDYSDEVSFAIYLVKAEEKTIDVLRKNINRLELEEEPIITDKNISDYYWDEHKFTLINDENLINTLEEKVYWKTPVSGKPFVVVCNSERIYLGLFWTRFSSLNAPICPVIISDDKDALYFEIDYFNDNEDIRNDKKIYEVFEKLGKLR